MKGLLDEIAESVESYYLSDIHMMKYRRKVWIAIEKLDASEYPLQEWKDAVGYILKEPIQGFETQEQARSYLLTRLKKPEEMK